MSQGSRPERVGDQIRGEIASLLAREVHDPGVGFVTLTRVQVSADLQQARVYYTALGDEAARRRSAQALQRAAPFLRRQIGSRLRLRRVPELTFVFDQSVAGQDRIEQLLRDIDADLQDSGRGSRPGPPEPQAGPEAGGRADAREGDGPGTSDAGPAGPSGDDRRPPR